MSKHTEHEIISHGYENSQYFQGCGCGKMDHVFTGCGMDEAEAYRDACEQAYGSIDGISLPSRPRGINTKRKVPASYCGEGSETYWYVSVRLKG